MDLKTIPEAAQSLLNAIEAWQLARMECIPGAKEIAVASRVVDEAADDLALALARGEVR